MQGIPAVLLALGIWWMPFSPRWLVKQGRDDAARKTLAWLRKRDIDDDEVQVEFLEIKAERLFEDRVFQRTFPKLVGKVRRTYLLLITVLRNCMEVETERNWRCTMYH